MSENEKYLKRDALSEGDVDGGVNIRGKLPFVKGRDSGVNVNKYNGGALT